MHNRVRRGSTPLIRGKDSLPVGQALLWLLRSAYWLATRLLPVSRRKVCFASFPDAADNALAMFRHFLAEEPGYRLVWLVNDVGGVAERLRRLGLTDPARVEMVPRRSLRALFHTATARYYFHTHGFLFFGCLRRGQAVINLWHGMPLKTIGRFDGKAGALLPKGDFAIATSDFFAGIIAEAFAMPVERVWVTGQPRNDVLVAEAPSSSADAELPQTPYILWMPTYRASAVGEIRKDSDADGAIVRAFHDLDLLLRDRDVRVVVKLHPMDALNGRDFSHLENVEVIPPDLAKRLPVESLLRNADRLITDYSSVFIDYALLGRPIGFYVPDMGEYRRGFIPSVVDRVGLPGTRLASVDELMAFVAHPDPPAPSEESMALIHAHRNGSSAARIMDKIKETTAGGKQSL